MSPHRYAGRSLIVISGRPSISGLYGWCLAGHGCDIAQHQQFGDDVRGRLFLRIVFS